MSQASTLEREMLDLINAERTSRGLNEVQLELRLNDSAEDHSAWMLSTGTFSHTGVGGSSATERMVDAGFVLSGSWRTAENIAWQSQRGAEGFSDDVVDLHRALMNSSGHRANILNPELTVIGIGIEIGRFDGIPAVMVTQNFARTSAPLQLDIAGAPSGGGDSADAPPPPPPPLPDPDPVEVVQVPEEGPGVGPTSEQEVFEFDGETGILRGTPRELDDDILRDFDTGKTLILEGVAPGRSNIQFSGNSQIEIDTDGDGDVDVTISLGSARPGGDIFAVSQGGHTVITYADYLPGLSEGARVDSSLVNGIVNKDFLAGDGSTDFRVQMANMGVAGHDNVLGVYEIQGNGEITNVRLIYDNVKTASGPVTLEDVNDGNRLGFFIVQDGADWADSLVSGDVLDFSTIAGAEADIDDDFALFLTVNGANAGVTAFHSENAALNVDGQQHALSGIAPGGEAMIVGFEDLTGGGDYDFEDVVFSVTRLESDALSIV